MLGFCKDTQPLAQPLPSSPSEQEDLQESVTRQLEAKTQAYVALTVSYNAALQEEDRLAAVSNRQELETVGQETLRTQKAAEEIQREMAVLKPHVEQAESEMEQDKALFARIEDLRRQLAGKSSSGPSISALRTQLEDSQSDHVALQKKCTRAVHDLESLEARLQVSEGTRTRLDGKTSELQRLVDDVTGRSRMLRRVELLRNVQILWSRRVFLQLTRLLARWQSATS